MKGPQADPPGRQRLRRGRVRVFPARLALRGRRVRRRAGVPQAAGTVRPAGGRTRRPAVAYATRRTTRSTPPSSTRSSIGCGPGSIVPPKRWATPASYVSPRAFVWRNVKLGEHCFIFENNVLQPFVNIGDNVVLWSGNHIGHHSKIGDHCFVSSHVVVSGFCDIGANCFLGRQRDAREQRDGRRRTVCSGPGRPLCKDVPADTIVKGPDRGDGKGECEGLQQGAADSYDCPMRWRKLGRV